MKITMLLTLFLFCSNLFAVENNSALRRSNGLLRFIAEQEGLRDFALASIIGNRCGRYMDHNGKAPCKAAVKKMIQVLDYDVIFSEDKIPAPPKPDETWNPRSFVFVAFKTNLINLLSNQKTAVYLNDLNQQLYKFLVEEKARPNVWDITKAHYKTDYMTAMAIATLFQDTSSMKLHLAYLERANTQGNVAFQSNKELLSRVIDTINLILDSSEENYRGLFYPQEIQADLNRNIYHFYVPLFLSKSLEKEGIEKQYAYTAALMLTLSYEFITSSNDYRFLFKDPERIEGVHKLKDIFGGYCGSNIGVRGMNFNKSFEVIRASFGRSTKDAVDLLLKH